MQSWTREVINPKWEPSIALRAIERDVAGTESGWQGVCECVCVWGGTKGLGTTAKQGRCFLKHSLGESRGSSDKVLHIYGAGLRLRAFCGVQVGHSQEETQRGLLLR